MAGGLPHGGAGPGLIPLPFHSGLQRKFSYLRGGSAEWGKMKNKGGHTPPAPSYSNQNEGEVPDPMGHHPSIPWQFTRGTLAVLDVAPPGGRRPPARGQSLARPTPAPFHSKSQRKIEVIRRWLRWVAGGPHQGGSNGTSPLFVQCTMSRWLLGPIGNRPFPVRPK